MDRVLRRWLQSLLAESRLRYPDRVRRTLIDQLTGLPTRNVVVDSLRLACEQGTVGALVLIDVDHLKRFNDRFGHEMGDGLLQVVANRIESCAPNNAELGRMGGDEFSIVLPGQDKASAGQVAEEVLRCLRAPVQFPDGQVVVMTASAGVADLEGSINDTLRSADVAVYAAKARGRDRVVVFEDDTRQIINAKRELAATVVELQERNRALRDEARTDALTGLRNRLALNEVLELTVGADDSPWPRAAVAFVDIDHFGHFNKAHGDSRGDEALKQVTLALKAGSRQGDLLFRKGGEEMVVIVLDVEGESVRVAAERLRAAVQAAAIRHDASPTAGVVTVTVGIATGDPGSTIRQLMNAAADQAMKAKISNARNQVHSIQISAADARDSRIGRLP